MRELLLNIIHNTVREIIKISPTSSDLIFRSFSINLPFITEETYLHRHAFKNLLRLFGYAPSLRERGFLIIVEWLINVDVEIQVDDVDDKSDAQSKQVFSHRSSDRQNSLSYKMDEIMLILFEYLKEQMESLENRKVLFRILQKAFEKFIMLTHRSKYTQFLIFYVCSYDSSFVERFVGRLVDWYCSEESPVLTRQTCCVYCASFICRANFISIDIIRSVLYFSLTWINKYIDM